MEIARHLRGPTQELLAGFRAVVINGPRQAGKSTLVRQVQQQRGPVVTLDEPGALDAALLDPVGFLDGQPDDVAIDEFQRGGDGLLLALKAQLDGSDRRGQYLLAGSTRFLSTRTLSETLTGRIGLTELLPLSMGERLGVQETFLDALFAGHVVGPTDAPLHRSDYAELIAQGGFPEMVLGPTTRRFRTTWCDSYLRTVTALANVEQAAEVRRPALVAQLLDQVAARTAGEVVATDLSRELQASAGLVESYLAVLETLYLVRVLHGWTTSRTTRAKRRRRAHLVDTALAAHLVDQTGDDLARPDSPWFGPLLESFVVAEIAKQATWADRSVTLAHYRDRDQREVDLIVERGPHVAGIEVKATATPRPSDARHLAYLRDRLGDRFALGVVLHTGRQVVVLGDRLVAAPIATMWA
ncbi:MAG: ATP-binding protein [Ilumatobacteraceae bacterium]